MAFLASLVLAAASAAPLTPQCPSLPNQALVAMSVVRGTPTPGDPATVEPQHIGDGWASWNVQPRDGRSLYLACTFVRQRPGETAVLDGAGYAVLVAIPPDLRECRVEGQPPSISCH